MRSVTSFVRAFLALAAAAFVAGALLVAAPSATADSDPVTPTSFESDTARQAAANCNWRRGRCYGAIAINPATGLADVVTDRKSKFAAKKDAKNKCKNRPANEGFARHCTVAGWVRNGCGAVAFRVNDNELKEWAYAYAYSEDAAKRKAKDKLSGPGTRGIWAWVCTTRRR